jgi:hypothetical protein
MELENNKGKKKGPSRFQTGYTSFNPVPKLLTMLITYRFFIQYTAKEKVF